MLGWFGTPLGRILQALVGMALLWVGIMQATAVGLLVMMTGLIVTVAAAAPPLLARTAAVRTRSGAPATHRGGRV
jgi:hypothetical protein